MSEFIRIVRRRKLGDKYVIIKEMLINVGMIWKIEVEYYGANAEGKYWEMPVYKGIDDPEARRRYIIYIGNEVVKLSANPKSPVLQRIEEIYRDAITDPKSDEGGAGAEEAET
jgi:hypothetical protein